MYPAQRANGPDSRPEEDSSRRIEKLEVYIRRLGGDPQLIEQIVERGEASVKESTMCCPTTEARPIGDTASTSGPKYQTSFTKRMEGPTGKPSGLVEHDEQVTYIETYVPLRA